jgi:cyclohexanone monooxygenase
VSATNSVLRSDSNSGAATRLDAIVVGAGFAGVYMVHTLREMGRTVRAFEAGSGVGGTWFWNRYPGARCDVESMEYSYGFSEKLGQEWEWSERYSPQPEILSYINHVADRFDLRNDIQLNTTVVSAIFCEEAGDPDCGRWRVETSDGITWTADFFITAVGCLSSTNTPDFRGLASFQGDVYHTSRWPHEGVDFKGKRVGVIGTGSSGIQAVPIIAKEAAHLTVFQRTPNFSIPARNEPLAPEKQAEIKARYREVRALNRKRFAAFGFGWPHHEGLTFGREKAERRRVYEEFWEVGGLAYILAFSDLLLDERANEEAAEFVREKIRGVVDDPEVAELLCPDHAVGCKRPCADTGYYQTFNREDVSLIDVSKTGIERVGPGSVIAGGEEVELDCLVLATGFDAMTGSLEAIGIRGRDGVTLKEKWSAGPMTYLGLGSAGFPNLFTITGPGSPSVLANMVTAIEQHVEFIADTLRYMEKHGHALVEPKVEAENDWVAYVNDVAAETIYPTCNSWYLGANVPGKPRVFMPYVGFPPYVAKCEEIVAKDYEGFAFPKG